jgi:hypothetical protein
MAEELVVDRVPYTWARGREAEQPGVRVIDRLSPDQVSSAGFIACSKTWEANSISQA